MTAVVPFDPSLLRAEPSREDVDAFLRTTAFEGYHSVPLPYGRRVPGRDLSRTAEAVLGDRVRGRSVLDIGTFYGFYPYEAIRRGARFALGIEPRPERCAVAKRIAELNGGSYEILESTAEDLDPGLRFDVILLLRVLHWVRDPVAFLSRLASMCREQVIVEFRRPSHGDHLRRFVGGSRLRLRAAQLALDVLGSRVPIATIGPRGCFFTPAGFRQLFVEQTRIFASVEFTRSPTRSCTIAHCRVAGPRPVSA